MDFKLEFAKALNKTLALDLDQLLSLIEIPPNPALGDFAFPCFTLSKQLKQAPAEIAKKLADQLNSSFFSRFEATGPYLNAFLNKAFFAKDTLSKIEKEKNKYGAGKEKEKIVIEYCSPNTNKPLHLGHIRNMALGDSLSRIQKFLGKNVKTVQIINGRGVHICKSMLAYQKYGKNEKPTIKGDHFVGDYYVIFAKEAKDNPDLEIEAQELLKKWEAKEAKVRSLWKKMNKWVMEGFEETYTRFGITFDKNYFESDFYEKGKAIVTEGLKKGVFVKDDKDAVIAPLQQYGLSDKVILRPDGTSIYITQDLYLAELRYKDFKFNQLLYVVASEQNLHFEQLFKILELLQRPFAKGLVHLSYGMVHLPSGRMKSREGTVIDADDIMDEIAGMAEEELRKREHNLTQKELKQRAESIGLSAIKFFMLKMDATKDIIFNPEESLSFEGETGPYLQYTHARATSILKKATPTKGKIDFNLLQAPEEMAVINLLSQFPNVLKDSAEHYKPHLVCHYLLALAQAFNGFYHAHPVLSNDKKQTASRLLLVKSTKQVLATGLTLLGIVPLNEM